MAGGDGEGEKEYESDPEEAKLSLKMRRREASDDDDEDEEVASAGGGGAMTERGRENPAVAARVVVDSDAESEGQGGVDEYDEEELEVDDEDEYYDEEEEEKEEEEEDCVEERGGEIGDGERLEAVEREVMHGREGDMGLRRDVGESSEGRGRELGGESQMEEGKKKENEPFAVPTAGAFYMHDDRFRDNVGGRHRRTFVGRKLWEIKDDRKWGHDKFEEMNMQERHYGQGRKSSRGRSRGRARGRGTDRWHVWGNNRERTHIDNKSQNVPPKGVRGRGPTRYQPLAKHRNEAPAPQNIRSKSPVEKTSHTSSVRVNVSLSKKESERVAFKKIASNLSSSSPPFYPSGSSNKEIGEAQKKDVQTGGVSRNVQSSVVEEKFPVHQSNLMRGKNVVNATGIDKISIDNASSARPSVNMHVPPSFLSTSGSQGSQPRGQGRGVSFSGSNSFQASSSQNQSSKVQGRGQAFLPASAQQLGQRAGSVSQASSPPRSGLSISALESGDSDSPESSKSKTAMVGKGKGTIQGGGRGSFVYGGTQVMGSTGAMGSVHVDPNFPGAPTFLPVMQFGAQHPGGIGVPAVGMAFPGYVANPQLGLGNSEMTWLPVLAGASGALGATYCPPYIAVDGSYHARPAGQTPPALAASSKDNNLNKPTNEWKPQQKPEVANDEFSQRQNKPRRYSEMSFGQ